MSGGIEAGDPVGAGWAAGALEVVVPGPGVYRVEVWMTPRQLAPYLGAVAANYTETPVPWIYSGAIFVR